MVCGLVADIPELHLKIEQEEHGGTSGQEAGQAL